MAEQRLRTEKLLAALELAVKEFEIAAVLTPEAQHRESPHNAVHDLLQCLQGESQDCCAHSHAASACAHASGDIRKALQALREAVGDAEAKRLVKAKYPRVGMLGRFLRAQGKILALALATALFTYWFVTPRKIAASQAVPRFDIFQTGVSDMYGLRELRHEVFTWQSPKQQFQEILTWAYAQKLSWSTVMRAVRELLTAESRSRTAKIVLAMWMNPEEGARWAAMAEAMPEAEGSDA